jgi:hypothetical protein
VELNLVYTITNICLRICRTIFYNEIKNKKKYKSIREDSISTDESELILNLPGTVQCFVPTTKYLERVKVLRFTPDIRVHKFLLGEFMVKKLRKIRGCSLLLKSVMAR